LLRTHSSISSFEHGCVDGVKLKSKAWLEFYRLRAQGEVMKSIGLFLEFVGDERESNTVYVHLCRKCPVSGKGFIHFPFFDPPQFDEGKSLF
jgi:hypothetical protein